MADVNQKFPENVAGKYFVDETCISCDTCTHAAPKNFAVASDAGHSFVSKQPENAEEEAQCQEAVAQCPVEAIGCV